MTDPVELIAEGVRGLIAQDPHSLPDTTLLMSTESIVRIMNQLSGVMAARLQVIDVRDATVAEYGRQTRSWLVEELHLGQEDASRHMTVAKALPSCPAIGAALEAGDITIDHARIIAIGVRKVSPEIRDVFEKEMVKAAEFCDPTELARFSRELRSRLGAEESAEAAEQRKYDARWMRITPTFEGMHAIDGMLDPASAATLSAALAPLLGRTGADDQRTAGQRCADGLTSIAELALRTGELPEHGGEKPQVIVTIGYDTPQSRPRRRPNRVGHDERARDQPGHRPDDRLRRRDHPRGARRCRRGARPRPQDPALEPCPTTRATA